MNDAAARLEALYRETILEHAGAPVGFGSGLAATHRAEGRNARCGDHVQVSLAVRERRVDDLGFDGESCAICTASASLMCATMTGRPVAELEETAHRLVHALDHPNPEPRDAALPEALQPLLGVRAHPARLKCALLPWITALEAVATPGEA